MEHFNALQISSMTQQARSPTHVPPRVVEHFHSIASRELIKKKVIDALMDDGTNLIGVYGMGGIGKTTLMKQIREETEQLKLFDKSVLVSVSQNPDLRCIQTQIAESLGIKIEEKRISVRANILSAELASRGENILLIFDDMWKKLDLAVIGIILGGSTYIVKALLTSRILDICHSMKTIKNIYVNVLSEYDSLELFRKEVGDADFNNRRKLCEELVNECHGLPLAIVALARTLRLKDIFFWEALNPLLKKSIYDGLDVVKTSIKRSYNYLQSNETKQCFLLCALFPKDHKIGMDTILGYGVGEGLFGDDGTLREARGNLHLMVETLISCSLLLKSNEEGYVIMHNVIRDTALWIARERKNESIIRAGLGLKKWPNVEAKSSLRISLMSNDIHEVPETPDCSQLVTLSLASNPLLKEVPDGFFEDMKHLRVLDLSQTSIFLLPQSLASLKICLRSLYLDDCKFIQTITAIGDLKELEILSLQRSGISELPEELKGLTNLKMLNLSESRCLTYIPPGVISSMYSLEELYMGASFHGWEIEEGGDKAGLVEVATLFQLASLHLDIENPKWIYTEMSMYHWRNLRLFRINLPSEEYYDTTPVYERHLSLGIMADSFPLANWFKVLMERTFELVLWRCEGFKNILQLNSKGFTSLKSLTIRGSKTMEYVMDVEEQLPRTMSPQLEILNLCFLEELKAIWNGPFLERSFDKLKVLTVEGCGSLVNILPSRLWTGLELLEEIKIVNCCRLEELGSKEYNEIEELTDDYQEKEVEEDNNTRIWLPNLRILYLINLPRLSSLFFDRKKLLHVTLECPYLGTLTIGECPNLERLPFSLQSMCTLQKFIIDDHDWFQRLRWEHKNVKSQLQCFLTVNDHNMGNLEDRNIVFHPNHNKDDSIKPSKDIFSVSNPNHNKDDSITPSRDISSTSNIKHHNTKIDGMWQLKIQDGSPNGGVPQQSSFYPNRPGEPNCKYYLRTGTCVYGVNCRFNHPAHAVGQVQQLSGELPERVGQPECQDERPCQYYMRNGTCKVGSACKFHHPQPVGGVLPVTASAYGSSSSNVGGLPSGGSYVGGLPACSTPYVARRFQGRTVYEVLFKQRWNTYTGSMSPGVLGSNSYASKDDLGSSAQGQLLPPTSFPERPDQPECQFYMRTGSCKYGPSCKYNHPKERIPAPATTTMGSHGLPLRPGRAVCMVYSTYGICKYGPNCKFDHPNLQIWNVIPNSTSPKDSEDPLRQTLSPTVASPTSTEPSQN